VDVRAEGERLPGDRSRCHRDHALCLEMRARLGGALLAPDASVGAMATVPLVLPPGVEPLALEKQLLVESFEAPIVDSIIGPLLRVSAHLYNHIDQVDLLVAKLASLGVRISA
jgi:hypothetical protein